MLWKMKFDSRIIKTSDLMDFEVGKDGKGGSFPLKSIMTEKSIYVLDEKGGVAKKIPVKHYAKVVMSDDGTTMATMKGREITISNLDEKIQGIVKIADPQPVVLPQHVSFELSPGGKHIIVLSFFTHNIYFHNRKGELLATHHVDDLRGTKVKFSRNGEYAAIHVPNWGEGKTTGYLLLFNRKGKKLWRFDHKGCQAMFDASSDGNFIIIAAEDRFYSLDKKGKLLHEKELIPGEMNIALSGDGKYSALARVQDHSVSLMNTITGKTLWTFKTKGFDPIKSRFTSLDISNKGKWVAACISKNWKRTNKESFLYFFNKAGHVIWENTFEKCIVAGVISPQDGCVLVKGDREGYLYRF